MRARARGRRRQTARIAERLHTAAARVDPPTEVSLTSRQVRDLLPRQNPCLGTMASPRLRASLGGLECLSRVGGLNPTMANGVALYGVTIDQVEDQICGAADGAHNAWTEVGTEHAIEFIWVVFQSRDHLSAIAA